MGNAVTTRDSHLRLLLHHPPARNPQTSDRALPSNSGATPATHPGRDRNRAAACTPLRQRRWSPLWVRSRTRQSTSDPLATDPGTRGRTPRDGGSGDQLHVATRSNALQTRPLLEQSAAMGGARLVRVIRQRRAVAPNTGNPANGSAGVSAPAASSRSQMALASQLLRVGTVATPCASNGVLGDNGCSPTPPSGLPGKLVRVDRRCGHCASHLQRQY